MNKPVLFSIVSVVIVGMLFAGMIFAQNMIDGIQAKKFIKTFEQYDTAANFFKQKIGGLPGDTDNAGAYWGLLDGDCYAEAAESKKTCNGNNNGQIDYEDTRKFGYEPWRFWQQLSLSGIIAEQYSGVMDNSCSAGFKCYLNIPAKNVPQSSTNYSDIISIFYITKKHFDWSGKKEARNVYALGSTENHANAADKGRWWGQALTPEEAFFFDEKYDDGLPFSGGITAVRGEKTPNCVSGDSKADEFIKNSKEKPEYNVAHPEKACVLLIDTKFN